ncbi:TPM domain-containing protein [Rhodoferax sp.]|uniref:TPM domain-containing protein n=1 Tax=Rhodoferax sp. TaxID=50421 RepID=UPI002ACE11DE|nr:TPM domain-containing protein [Rhodoferax sp.]MDZ7922253.1 TPM domain-containing protein [Rhodoferax sp.]
MHVLLRWRQALALGFTGFALAVSAPVLHAQDLQPVPTLSSHAIDTTGTLTAAQREALDGKLSAFEATTGAQLVVLMVGSTAPEDIASYANRVGNTWKIGRREVGDGLILLVAKNDRKLRIEVAKTLEGAVPDLMAKRVIDQAIAPRFKEGNFAGGIDAGVEQLMALVRGEALPAPVPSRTGPAAGFQWMDLAVFLFFAVAVGGSMARRALGNKLGSLLTGGVAGGLVFFVTSSLLLAGLAAVAALVLTLLSSLNKHTPGRHSSAWSSTGSGGGWNSGSGGGGFSSGGGGNFGGGGASGGW